MYIQSCYNDLIDCVEGDDIIIGSDAACIPTAKKLFYVMQYKLVERFTSKEKLLKLASEYIDDIKSTSKTSLQNANKLLRVSGLLMPVLKMDKQTAYEQICRDAHYYNDGGSIDLNDVFKNPCFTRGINLYLSLLKDLLNKSGFVDFDILDVFKGELKGVLVEYYATSQESLASQMDFSIKLELARLSNASEIDIFSSAMHSLIEVGIGNKSTSQLAFCDKDFEELYPEYKDYGRIYVSSRDKADRHNGYLEVPYWMFGLYCDMICLYNYKTIV